MKGTNARLSIGGQPLLRVIVPPILVLGALAAMMAYFSRPPSELAGRDDDLCPLEKSEIAGSAVYLVDLNKPLAASSASLPGDLLHDISLDLASDTELRVFSLAGSASAPRVLLKRLCKPYDNAELHVSMAKDQRGAMRDCDDLPAQLNRALHEVATQFCVRRNEVRRQLDALAGKASRDEQVRNAYLVEAIEDTKLDFLQRPAPRVLYVFSDLMQHGNWYSHLDLGWADWSSQAFGDSLALQSWRSALQEPLHDFRVEAFYLPRAGRTDQPRIQVVHKRFWREYFGSADVVFHDQPTMRYYAAQPLMHLLSDAEIAVQERVANEQLLHRIQQEREALTREQRELEAELRRQEEERQQVLMRASTPLPRRRDDGPAALEPNEREGRDADQAQSGRNVAVEGPYEEQDSKQEVRPTEHEPSRLESLAGSEDQPSAPTQVELEKHTPQQLAGERLPTSESDPPLATNPNADSRAATERAATTEAPVSGVALPPCDLAMSSNPEFAVPTYPRGGRMNMGNAVITVQYVVNEQGNTVDEDVTVVRAMSRADRGRYFSVFAVEALEAIERWTFTFIDPDASCKQEQTRTTSFEFKYE